RELAEALAALAHVEAGPWSNPHVGPFSARTPLPSEAVTRRAPIPLPLLAPPVTPSATPATGASAAMPAGEGASPGRDLRTAPGLSSSVDTGRLASRTRGSRLAGLVVAGAGGFLALGLGAFLLLHPSPDAERPAGLGASAAPLSTSAAQPSGQAS